MTKKYWRNLPCIKTKTLPAVNAVKNSLSPLLNKLSMLTKASKTNQVVAQLAVQTAVQTTTVVVANVKWSK